MIKLEDGKCLYEEGDMILKPTWWQERGLHYTASGYGKKIPTQYVMKVAGRMCRVYCCIFSNIGTLYVIRNGREWVLSQF